MVLVTQLPTPSKHFSKHGKSWHGGNSQHDKTHIFARCLSTAIRKPRFRLSTSMPWRYRHDFGSLLGAATGIRMTNKQLSTPGSSRRSNDARRCKKRTWPCCSCTKRQWHRCHQNMSMCTQCTHDCYGCSLPHGRPDFRRFLHHTSCMLRNCLSTKSNRRCSLRNS